MTTVATPSPVTVRAAPRPDTARLVLTALAVGAVVLVAALYLGDAQPHTPALGLPYEGVFTDWALPVMKLVSDLSGAATLGLVMVGAFLYPAPKGELRGRAYVWTRRAAWPAAAWALSTAAVAVLTVSDVLAVGVGGALNPSVLRSFLFDVPLGRALLVQVLLALVVAAAIRWVTTSGGAAVVFVVGVAGVLPPGLTGHSGASSQHSLAVTSLMVHSASASVWIGGLAALVVLAREDVRGLATALPRFSVVALWAVVAIVLSGVANAALRVHDLGELVTTRYGALICIKIVLVCALSGFGWWHRRHVIARLDEVNVRRLFARIATVEVLVMSATIGVAVALIRSAPPVDQDPVVPEGTARAVLGFDLPPHPTTWRIVLGEARPDGIFITAAVLALALYAMGLRQLRRRGAAWPVGRTLSWVSGWLLVTYCTSGGLGTYAEVLFSTHMIQHMLLTMVAPILLVLGAPTTLALRTLPARPGESGPRDWLMAFLHSRFIRLVASPIFSSLLFVGSFYAIYFTQLFPFFMGNHWGHELMSAHFLLVGSLFFWTLIGVDPGPRRLPYPGRVGLLFATMPFHAFFAVALISSNQLFAGDYFASLSRPYDANLLSDQQLAGGIAWQTGELPTLIVIAALFLQWIRSDERAARRYDRQADRAERGDTGGADELGEYNAYLASLNDRPPTGPPHRR
jgi:cytochrome c oxidase assembly factor CtaG/putative copper export protein